MPRKLGTSPRRLRRDRVQRRRTATAIAERRKGRPRLLAEDVANAIVERTARGYFRPGQRLIETEVARELGVSRLPLREALKALESQGIVVSTPHRGTRLMEVNESRLQKVLEVRRVLERLALDAALPVLRANPEKLKPFDRYLRNMERAVLKGDRFGLAIADLRFHRELCVASGNEVLLTLWNALSRQLIIIFGLASLRDPSLHDYYMSHVKLRRLLVEGDVGQTQRAIENHASGWHLPPATADEQGSSGG
jgi:DNA-binding GntR family transcriptional regulator